MWLMVMFDLPVVLKKERKEATDFRNALLDMGFEMTQFSVYLRFCTSQTQIDSYSLRVKNALPPGGKVSVLQMTDKQLERMQTYQGKRAQSSKKAPDQFVLF